MSQQSAGEKTEQATPRRKQDARKKGTVARSTDLTGALVLFGVALIGPGVMTDLATRTLTGVNGGLFRMPTTINPETVTRSFVSLAVPAAMAIAPLMALVLVLGLASQFAQVGFVLSGEPLNPTLSRLNPFPGIQRMFSVRSTFDGLKAMAKMAVFGWVACSTVMQDWDRLTVLSTMAPVQAAAVIGSLIHTIVLRIAVVWLIIGVADYIFQRKQVDKQLMMTKDELRREMREQEGSPEVKGAQMRRRRQLAKGGLASKLKTADVVVTNPTHFAVALSYDRSRMHAPMVVAKGVDYLALRIKDMARDLDVPVVENKPLARALYKQCEAGDFVPRDLFAPVAEVLAYVYQTVEKVRRKAS